MIKFTGTNFMPGRLFKRFSL